MPVTAVVPPRFFEFQTLSPRQSERGPAQREGHRSPCRHGGGGCVGRVVGESRRPDRDTRAGGTSPQGRPALTQTLSGPLRSAPPSPRRYSGGRARPPAAPARGALRVALAAAAGVLVGENTGMPSVLAQQPSCAGCPLHRDTPPDYQHSRGPSCAGCPLHRDTPPGYQHSRGPSCAGQWPLYRVIYAW